jgi:hypothetical protein
VYLTNKEGDINSLHACKDAGSIDIASKILYQYIYLKEKSRNDRNSRVQLKDIIKNTIDEQYSDYSHLEAFKSELINGRLPIAISQLLSNKFDALTEQVNKISETFSQNFDNLKDKIKEFLHSKLNKVTIDQSLESKIFSAYLISSSEGKALGLLDKYLSRAINDLDGRNGIYSSNILLSVEEKTVAGKGTRVGVVPPNQNFNQVMKLLENVFEKVRELANESNPLAYTIVKIDPSQTTFKHLAFNTTTTFDPSDIIKTLIIDKFSPLLNMSLMAINSSNPLENVVMVDLIKEFFNTQTTLYLLISDNLVGLSTKSLTYMKNRNLDTALLTRYQASSLCDLAYKMYSSNKNLGEEKTKKNLSNAIKESFVESQITISEDELTTLTSQIFSKLENIATIIQLS